MKQSLFSQVIRLNIHTGLVSFQLVSILEENVVDHWFISFLLTQNSVMFGATYFYSLVSLDLCKSHLEEHKK